MVDEAAKPQVVKPLPPPGEDEENAEEDDGEDEVHDYAFASRYNSKLAPRDKLPPHSFSAHEAYQIIKDMRQLDQNPRLNLASFVTTWMEPEAEKTMVEAFNVNFVDADQYRSCQEIEKRCICMLASLYNSPDPETSPGAGCIGSSEAIMLAALSMKKRWVARRKAAGKEHSNPNIVMGHNIQVCWEKFCRYFDVEARYVPLELDCFTLNVNGVRDFVDENTIGLVGVLGSTYTGSYDDIAALNDLSEQFRDTKGWELPIHVDAASGGFVAPFLSPNLKWDFRLKNVISINVSGHKYGLVYAGIGWVIFRNQEALQEDLIFNTSYLGSNQPNITLNFSRGAANIVAQYYQFLRLGWHGYHGVMKNLMKVTNKLRRGIEDMETFRVVNDTVSLPLVAFSVIPGKSSVGQNKDRIWDEFELSNKLRERGWMIPAYAMAPNAQSLTVMRIVVREDMTMSMVESLLKDLAWAVDWLNAHFIFTLNEVGQMRKKFKDELRISSIARGRSCA